MLKKLAFGLTAAVAISLMGYNIYQLQKGTEQKVEDSGFAKIKEECIAARQKLLDSFNAKAIDECKHVPIESIYISKSNDKDMIEHLINARPTIGYKLCVSINKYGKTVPVIVKCYIPLTASIIEQNDDDTNKFRVSVAYVLAITSLCGTETFNSATSIISKDKTFTYKLNEFVTPKDKFNTNVNNSCVSGLHFYRTSSECLSWIKDNDAYILSQKMSFS